MRKIFITSAGALACYVVAGCATPQQQVAAQENLLAAAGFTVLPANTAERQSELAMLPPNRFIMRPNTAGALEYVYADPLNCNCLYIGTQMNYNSFRYEEFQLRLANQAQSTALLYSDAALWNRWDWGPWGPGWWR